MLKEIKSFKVCCDKVSGGINKMIVETKTFRVYCDRCGAAITNSAANDKIYHTEQDAEVDVDFQGWTKIQISGANPLRVIHLCPACAMDTIKAFDKVLAGKRR